MLDDVENNEPQIICCSSYYDIDTFIRVAQSKPKYFSILSTHIQSINVKFDELEDFVEELSTSN